MIKIVLLQEYQSHGKGDIISVSSNVASDLIKDGLGRETDNRDFLVKPEFGASKAIDSKKLHKSRRRR